MKILYQAHSGLRYLVLLAGLMAIAYFTFGLIKGRPVNPALRSLGSAFAGLLDLQIVLGVALLAGGLYYPAVIGHLVLMVLAAAVAHGSLVANRRKAHPGWIVPLAGVIVALALVAAGVLAIGRMPWASRAFGP